MWFLLILVIAILIGLLKYRETFIIKYGNPFDDEDLLSFDRGAKGTRIFSTTPDTCPSTKSDLDAGLCYEPCQDGYHGVGPVCWANSVNVGIGLVLQPRSCEDSGFGGYEDWGLLCQNPIRAVDCKFRGLFNECWPGLVGGEIGAKQLTCDNYGDRDNVDALCYKKCPKNLPNRVPGMPYLCFEGSRGLSYGRGVGEIPPIMRFGE
jgi:hypothetical protein